jgi:hypothetical protein
MWIALRVSVRCGLSRVCKSCGHQCVCEREREKERQRDGKREREGEREGGGERDATKIQSWLQIAPCLLGRVRRQGGRVTGLSTINCELSESLGDPRRPRRRVLFIQVG